VSLTFLNLLTSETAFLTPGLRLRRLEQSARGRHLKERESPKWKGSKVKAQQRQLTYQRFGVSVTEFSTKGVDKVNKIRYARLILMSRVTWYGAERSW